MGKLFDKFSGNARNFILNRDANRAKTAIDFAINATPWIVGLSFFVGGVYGLESFLAIDFSKKSVENLKKNKMLSDVQKDFYILLGEKIIEEAEYNKIKNKKLGKISDENSILATWKSVYDK